MTSHLQIQAKELQKKMMVRLVNPAGLNEAPKGSVMCGTVSHRSAIATLFDPTAIVMDDSERSVEVIGNLFSRSVLP